MFGGIDRPQEHARLALDCQTQEVPGKARSSSSSALSNRRHAVRKNGRQPMDAVGEAGLTPESQRSDVEARSRWSRSPRDLLEHGSGE